MKIEYKNKNYKNESIYQVGNVIEEMGFIYLVAKMVIPGEHTKYFLVDLRNSSAVPGMYESLEELEQNSGSEKQRLVKAKLIIDYKLVGDAEDERKY